MRKNISFWMLGIAAMLASCNQSEDVLQADSSTQNNEVQVTFNVQTPEILTRATIPAEADEATATRFICEVYEGSDAANLPIEPYERKEQSDKDFTLLLKKNTDYVFLLWADHGTVNDTENTNYYNAGDLKNVQVPDATAADKCAEVAFYACQPIRVSSTGSIGPITLNHAVAKVCLYETSIIAQGASLQVSYTPGASFNVAQGTVASAQTSVTLTYNVAEDALVDATQTEKGQRIAYFYLLAPEKGKAEGLNEMSFTLTEPNDDQGERITNQAVGNVPLQANYITNIRGEFSDYTSGSFDVSLNKGWTEEIEKELTTQP